MRILLLLLTLLAMPAAAEVPGFPHGFPITPETYTEDEIRAAVEMCRVFYMENRKFSTNDRRGLGIACGTLKK